MCDTLCSLDEHGSIFAKNSDRPCHEPQLLDAVSERQHGGLTATQYRVLEGTPHPAMVLARPDWLFGAEHGVNAHGVAIGNEKVFTTEPLLGSERGLIGMDLVRLALERSATASEAVDVIGSLVEAYGQAGPADPVTHESYSSSFLITDRRDAWIVETADRRWVAAPVESRASISNRLSLGPRWTLATKGIDRGDDFDRFRDPARDTSNADRRLASTTAFLAESAVVDLRNAAAALRDHGTGPWGIPGQPGPAEPTRCSLEGDDGIMTVCMHLRGDKATTSSMVTSIPRDVDEAIVGAAALGSPCVLPFLPFALLPGCETPLLPTSLRSPRLWHLGAALRTLVEHEPAAIDDVRRLVGPIEAELFDRLEHAGSDPTLLEMTITSADACAERYLLGATTLRARLKTT